MPSSRKKRIRKALRKLQDISGNPVTDEEIGDSTMLKNLMYLADVLPISGAYPNGAPPSIPFVHGTEIEPLRDDITTYGSGSIFSNGEATDVGALGGAGEAMKNNLFGLTGSSGKYYHYLMGVEPATSSQTEGILYGPNGPHTGYTTRYQPQKFYRFVLSGSSTSSPTLTGSGPKDHYEYFVAGGGVEGTAQARSGFPDGCSHIKSIFLVISGNLSGSTAKKGAAGGTTYDEVNVYTSSFKETGYLPTASLTGGAGYAAAGQYTSVEISTSSFPVYIVFTASQTAAGNNPTGSYAGFALWWTGSTNFISGSGPGGVASLWNKTGSGRHGKYTIDWGD